MDIKVKSKKRKGIGTAPTDPDAEKTFPDSDSFRNTTPYLLEPSRWCTQTRLWEI